jgi:hypothetical protein
MDDLAGRIRRLDYVQEPNELLMTMALHVAADHRASRTLRAANNVVVPWRT